MVTNPVRVVATRVLIPPCPSAVMAQNRLVNSVFVRRNRISASMMMARVRRVHSFCVKPSPASRPASKSSRIPNTPRPQCPSLTRMPFLSHPRTLRPPVVIHPQVFPSLHPNPPITSVSASRMCVYHSTGNLTCATPPASVSPPPLMACCSPVSWASSVRLVRERWLTFADTSIGPMHFGFSSLPVRNSGSLRARTVFVSRRYYPRPFRLTYVH